MRGIGEYSSSVNLPNPFEHHLQTNSRLTEILFKKDLLVSEHPAVQLIQGQSISGM